MFGVFYIVIFLFHLCFFLFLYFIKKLSRFTQYFNILLLFLSLFHLIIFDLRPNINKHLPSFYLLFLLNILLLFIKDYFLLFDFVVLYFIQCYFLETHIFNSFLLLWFCGLIPFMFYQLDIYQD